MKNTFQHKLIAIVMSLVLFASIIKSTSSIAYFIANQKNIAETLCVQKEDQQGCNGKCQLVKALKKDIQNNTESPVSTTKNNILIFSYLQPVNTFKIKFIPKNKFMNILDGSNYRVIQKYYDIYTPPPLFS